MVKVFSRRKRHPFAAKEEEEEQPAMAPLPYQSVTVEQWNEIEEMPPPSTTRKDSSSPAQSKSTNSTIDEEQDDPFQKDDDDIGLSCSGLLGEEVLLDTGFGACARSAMEATAESLRKLSESITKPIHKEKPKQKSKESSQNIISFDAEAILKENERLKRENTWLAEENESLRGGTYRQEEEDILSHQTATASV